MEQAHGLRAATAALLPAAVAASSASASALASAVTTTSAALQADSPSAPRAGPIPRSSGINTDAVDLLAILRASQALSSETSLERLCGRVTELIGAMTGATRVTLALHGDDGSEVSNVEGNDSGRWRLAPAGAGASLPVEQAAARGLLPLSALRYALRTATPLVVADATRDDRFARDPYLAGRPQCSLLVAPILKQGAPRAMLLLENTLGQDAFSAGRLDIVMLVAGQLAVSLENAQLYAALERKVAERTAALE